MPRTPPSFINSLPSSYLLIVLTLADQKSDLCKTNALRSEWSGAQLDLPHFLLYLPGQLGHWVYNAPATINIFTVLYMCSMESIQFPWNILCISCTNNQLIIHLNSWFLLPLSYMVYLLCISSKVLFLFLNLKVFIECLETLQAGSRTEFLTWKTYILWEQTENNETNTWSVWWRSVRSYIKQESGKRRLGFVEVLFYQGALFYISARTRMKLGNKPCNIWEKQILSRKRDSILSAVGICWRGSDISRKAKDDGENKARRGKNWRQWGHWSQRRVG